jgi:hypothetical protein
MSKRINVQKLQIPNNIKRDSLKKGFGKTKEDDEVLLYSP